MEQRDETQNSETQTEVDEETNEKKSLETGETDSDEKFVEGIIRTKQEITRVVTRRQGKL